VAAPLNKYALYLYAYSNQSKIDSCFAFLNYSLPKSKLCVKQKRCYYKKLGAVNFVHHPESIFLKQKNYLFSVSSSFFSAVFSAAAFALSPKRFSVNSLETAAFSNLSFPDNVSITKPSS
jgi:hypothetical protein